MRIIDANVNRAREALRVMEEYARFVLGDASLTLAIKEMRHAFAATVKILEGTMFKIEGEDAATHARGSLIGARDIMGDVGRSTATSTEYERGDPSDVAFAAAKRLGEALRAIEEYGKTIDSNFARAVEQSRYRGYELERRLELTGRARERFGRVRLYVLLTESVCRGDWFATAEAALRGGADALQLREKQLSDREVLERAQRLVELCRKYEAMMIVNHRVDIAAMSGADGVHLGQEDLSVSLARRMLPPTCVVGLSTHTVEQVVSAQEQTPDYIAVGPMFASVTKRRDHVAGPETLAAARRRTSLPLAAIGGIDPVNVREVLAAAPCCLCVCRAIIAQSDVTQACTRLLTAMDATVGKSGKHRAHITDRPERWPASPPR